MLKNKNLLIGISFVFLMVVSAVVISLSLKNEKVDVNEANEEVLGNLDNIISNYVTNIDRIVQNSHDSDLAASGKDVYKIVQIVPNGVSTESALKKYVNNNSFATEVIDDNRGDATSSIDLKVDNKKINITVYNVTAIKDLIEAANSGEGSTGDNVGALNDADLIYVSCPQNNTYVGTNDVPEVVYNFLRTYAVGKNKPIIIDDTTSIKGGQNQITSNVVDLCTNVLFYRRLYNTPPWLGTWTSDNFVKFLNGANNNYSAYSKIENNASSGFDASVPYRALVISPDTSVDYSTIVTADIIKTNAFSDATRADHMDISVDYTTADAVTVDNLSFTYTDSEGVEKQKQYDMIYIAPGDYSGNDISSDVYDEIKDRALHNNTQRIIYASDLRVETTNSSGNQSTTNFTRLLSFLVTDSGTGVARYSNVLKVQNGYFVNMNADKAKEVADLINYSVFRDYGGTGAKSKSKFYVLEIEPCYPIDISLATSKSNTYYNDPGNIMYGVTADEIPANTEYYDFDLSKAKIAHATGIPYSQIELVQMSTEELISSKVDISDTYDLVYIGGNRSALNQYNELDSRILAGWGVNITNFGATYFGMYSHTGTLGKTQYESNQIWTKYVDANAAYGTVFTVGDTLVSGTKITGTYTKQNTFNVYNGNDLNTIKLEELIKYVDAGYPLMIGNDLWSAYSAVADKGKLTKYMAHDIDPDSNMYKFLEYVNANYEDSSKNVSMGLSLHIENTDTRRVANDNTNVYGSTLTNDVEIYVENRETEIKSLINRSETRPTFEITKCPADYVEGDVSSYINYDSEVGTNFTYKLVPSEGSQYVVELYVDEDGNGLFSESTVKDEDTGLIEWKASQASTGGTGVLTYFLENEDFYGLKSWKLLVKKVADADSIKSDGPSEGIVVASYTGNARYKRKDDVEKKQVRILQVFGKKPGASKWDDGHSLLLCTECQHTGTVNNCNMFYHGYNGPGTASEYLNAYGLTTEFNSKWSNSAVKIGVHEHNFGIVKYDTETDFDDWDSNFADILKEDYDFNIDIMTVDDYEKLVSTISTQTEEQRLVNVAAADQAYSDYIAAELALETSGTEEALRKLLQEGIDNGYSDVNTTNFESILKKREYHRIFYLNSTAYGAWNSFSAKPNLTKIVKAYNDYITYKDDIINAYNDYKEYSNLSYTNDEWLYKNYNMVVLGFSDNFGTNDMSDNGCNALVSYEKLNGNILTTHDTTTKYALDGSVNLTENLAEVFGMDRFHVTSSTVGTSEEYAGTQYLRFSIGQKEQWCTSMDASYTVTDSDISIDVTGNTINATMGNAVIGDTHTNLDDSLQIKLTIKDDAGNPIPNVGVWLWDGAAEKNNVTYKTTGTTDANGVVTFNYSIKKKSSTNSKYINYTLDDSTRNIKGVEYPKYFWTQMYISSPAQWSDALGTDKVNNIGYFTSIARTDSSIAFRTTWNQPPYKYAELEVQASERWNGAISSSVSSMPTQTGTNRASQVNSGIMTTYPFYISSDLKISSTHAQSLALDLEDEEIVVWYTLAGRDKASLSDTKQHSSMYAASPRDGMDNYYIYTKGNITYCGAGNSIITGANMDNNDERRLFINVIVNSVRNAKAKPKVTLYDPNSTKPAPTEDGKITVDDKGNYELPVDRKDSYPEFDFKVKVDNTAKIANVKIFYDLDYGKQNATTGKFNYSNKYVEDANHPLIKQYTTADIESGVISKIRKTDYPETLTPKSYFDPYGGSFTYIVIMATDTLGQVTYTRIKVYHELELFDLTYNNAVTVDSCIPDIETILKQKYTM